jgi:hypothetical protein
MRQTLLCCCVSLATLCFGTAGAQDLKIPQPSTTQQIDQEFGLGHVTITYSRPNTKGRQIFGNIEPYGLVWRTGANSATKIKLTDSVEIEGHWVVPGEYALFTIPGPDQWTMIFNQTANQWGAYAYDSKKDVLRFTVHPTKMDQHVETFTIQFSNVAVEHAELQLLWDNTALTLHLANDVDARVMANIDKAMQGEKKPYYFASIYYYNHNKDMRIARAWLETYDKMHPNQYNIKYWLARIQLKAGDKQAAIVTANEGLKLAQQEPSAEYIRMNKEVLADAGN